MTARHAQTQVKPRVSNFPAFFTAIAAGRHILNLIGMSALAIHVLIISFAAFCCTAPVGGILRSGHKARVASATEIPVIRSVF